MTRVASRSITTCPFWTGAPACCQTRAASPIPAASFPISAQRSLAASAQAQSPAAAPKPTPKVDGYLFNGGRWEGTTFDNLAHFWSQGGELVDGRWFTPAELASAST